MTASSSTQLTRTVGVTGAVFLGLGSILGTGVFVSIGLAADGIGGWVLVSIGIAAVLATLNGLSSAQLAARHPVSGGTYAYASLILHPTAGFVAGWLFLCAKSASAAAAALGIGSYAAQALNLTHPTAPTLIACGTTAVITGLVAGGLTRSNAVNTIVVSLTLASLGALVFVGLPPALASFRDAGLGESPPLPAALKATALVFVAYTGYGRIATLGEEIHAPRRNIPRAMIATLITSAVIYAAVGAVMIGTHATGSLATLAAPLGHPWLERVLSFGAVAAMLGVVLNLILGLSRVVLAMGRAGDLPDVLGRVHGPTRSPRAAVWAVGGVVGILACIGSLEAAWSFSAFTVLVYYALTNLSALRLPMEARLYPRWISVGGLIGCLSLAFWVEPRYWLAGCLTVAAGLTARTLLRRSAT